MAENISERSRMATAFTFARATAISSSGKGRNTLIFTRPTFFPVVLRICSMAALQVPAAEPMSTTAYSASSIR